jgi:putative oxidoreductase
MKLGLTMLRWTVGGLFFGHGAQKLFGWFGGHGLEGTGKFFEALGLRPGRRHATAAGATEAGGGALLALGLFTPAAAAALIGTMYTAIQKVHLQKGPWVTDGGYEYNLVLIAALVALADVGPGDLSLDHALGTELRGPLVALAALAGGIAGATVMTELGSTSSEEAASASESADQAEPQHVPAPEPAGARPVEAGTSG